MFYNIRCDNSLKVRIAAFQAVGPGSIPGCRKQFFLYVNSDFILLKFMCHRGSFRDDIYKKCVLCKGADNGLKHVVNECAKLKNERKQLLKDLNNINNRKDTELLIAIEFHYYSKSYTNKKESKSVLFLVALSKSFNSFVTLFLIFLF